MENLQNKNTQSKISKIKRVPVVEQVYEILKENIASQKWKIGEKIPSEKDLAEMFGVNRLTVRAALQKLNALGIVQTRVGEGTFVLNFNFRKYISEVSEFTMQPEQRSDVRDFRKLIELECARLAIDRGTEEEYSVLKKLAEKTVKIGKKLNKSYQDGSLEKDTYIDYTQADFNFHYQVCKMSHNALYINCFNLAGDAIYQFILMQLEEKYNEWILQDRPVIEYTGIHMHMEIYNAMISKNFELCKRIYMDMLDSEKLSVFRSITDF